MFDPIQESSTDVEKTTSCGLLFDPQGNVLTGKVSQSAATMGDRETESFAEHCSHCKTCSDALKEKAE